MDARDLPEDLDLKSDELVDDVQQGSRAPQALSVLTGFLGESDADGYHRLFTDQTFKYWIDIPDHAIRHRRRIPAEQEAFGGGSMLWVDEGALLVSGEVISTADAETSFLTGELSTKARFTPDDADLTFAPPPETEAEAGAGSPQPSPQGPHCCGFSS
jgi:hypothetical protein